MDRFRSTARSDNHKCQIARHSMSHSPLPRVRPKSARTHRRQLQPNRNHRKSHHRSSVEASIRMHEGSFLRVRRKKSVRYELGSRFKKRIWIAPIIGVSLPQSLGDSLLKLGQRTPGRPESLPYVCKSCEHALDPGFSE